MVESSNLNNQFRKILAGVLLGFFYLPLIWTCLKAFLFEDQFSIFWFEELFRDPSFYKALQNSLVLGFASSMISVGLSLIAVLRFSKNRQDQIYSSFMAITLSLPEIVLALSLLTFYSWLNWPLGFQTALIAHTTLTMAFSYWILSVHFQSLDRSIWEAAEDLGADSKILLYKIILPQMKPALMSSFWICFLISMDDFLISFFVTGSSYETLPLKLFSMIKVGLNPKVNALSFLILVVSGLILVGLYGVWRKISSGKRKFNEGTL